MSISGKIPKRKGKKYTFFLCFHTIILLLVVSGFGTNSMVNTEKLPPASPLVFIHGIILFGWYFLVVLQAWLIRVKKYLLHIFLGKISLLIAIGIIITGTLMTLDSYYHSRSLPVISVNLVQLVNFILFFSLSLYRRKSPAKHKRFILLASLSIILPAFSRIGSTLEMPDYFGIVMLLLCLLVMVIHDIKDLNKVHKVTAFGIVIILFGITCTVGLITSKSWAYWIESTLL